MKALTLSLAIATGTSPARTPPTVAFSAPALPARVNQVVLHVLGGPSYARPDRRFVFFPPLATQALWNPRFGAHWIVCSRSG